jgi:fermentation-respiration switch protein FrsA (DUF1100 family)
VRRMTASVIALVVTLAGIALLVRWLEASMAFYPVRGVQATPASAGLSFSDVRIPTDDGETLHGWWLEHPEPRAQVLFFHGNGGNLSLWLDVIVELRRRGWCVYAIDYRGSGASTGSPSETGLYRDAEASVRHFTTELQRGNTPVVFWGRSIGSPVAAFAASRQPPEGLVLEAPMPDVRSLLRTNPIMWLLSFFSSYRFPTSSFLQHYEGPLLVVHGDGDSIVPFDAGRRVFDAARSTRKTFAIVPGADHNDLHIVNPPLYWRAVEEFLRGLPLSR